MRLNYKEAAPDGYKAFARVHQYVAQSGLEPALVHLVYLRVSQINGCAYCVDLHWRDALAEGVSPRKVNAVAAWEEAPFFSPRERAAFTWAESLTRLAETKAPDADYERAREHFADKELADLTYAVALMNALNRLGVGFRRAPEGEA
jgi:AhpD family alkylhydroperoxidase